jgi:hypothetical protein
VGFKLSFVCREGNVAAHVCAGLASASNRMSFGYTHFRIAWREYPKLIVILLHLINEALVIVLKKIRHHNVN